MICCEYWCRTFCLFCPPFHASVVCVVHPSCDIYKRCDSVTCAANLDNTLTFFVHPEFIAKNGHSTKVRHTADATHRRKTLWTMRLCLICCPVLLPPFWFETSLVFWLYLPFVGEQEVDAFLWPFWPWLQHLLHYRFFSFFKPAQGCLLGRRHFSHVNRCWAKLRAVAGVCDF